MKITHVSSQVRDLDEAARFYGHLLQLPMRATDAGLEVRIGESILELQEDPRSAAADHLAFDIPPTLLPEARSWLQRRGVPLLTRDGRDEYEMPSSWNARSIYFLGPSGSVLELIERREVAGRTFSRFDAGRIQRISEVGIATADVPGNHRLLGQFGLDVYGENASESFSPIGDIHGLLILVTAGRAWMPTEHIRAAMAPLEVQVSGPVGLDLEIGLARVRSHSPVPPPIEKPLG